MTIAQTFKEDNLNEKDRTILLKDEEVESQLIEIQAAIIHLSVALKEVLALGTGAGSNWILC